MTGSEFAGLVQSRIETACAKSYRKLSTLLLLLAAIAVLSFSGASERNRRIATLSAEESALAQTILRARSALQSVRSMRADLGDFNCAAASDSVTAVISLEADTLQRLRKRLLTAPFLDSTAKKQALAAMSSYAGSLTVPGLRALPVGASNFQPEASCQDLALKDLAYLGWISPLRAESVDPDLAALADDPQGLGAGTLARLRALLPRVDELDRLVFLELMKDLDQRALTQAESWDTYLADVSLRQLLARMHALQQEQGELLRRKAGFVAVSLPGIPGSLALREVILLAPLALIVIIFLSWSDLRRASALLGRLADSSRYPLLQLSLEAKVLGLYLGDWLVLASLGLAASVALVQWDSIPRTLVLLYAAGLALAAILGGLRHGCYRSLDRRLSRQCGVEDI